ncbi:Autophagy protein 22 [Dissophora globulifera]|uniref:Autophagy-related protein n=1 Tax=Dissophora globulifera TaxID=979702 RepID=A0A9P6RL98_9FUNG|nr:Autophagy protein 22 [Dissophora globulifera]
MPYIQNGTYCGYGWVAAVLLVPLLIQDLASQAGVEASNHAIPCDTSVPSYKCVTYVLGHYIEPGTISLYISSLSSILSFFVSLSISAVADHGSYRKILLIVFSILGCLVALSFFAMRTPSLFWIGAILSPLGWTFYNIASVFSHSYLPLYGRAHPDVLEAKARGEPMEVVRKIEEQKTNDISTYSVVIAYSTLVSIRKLPIIFKFMAAWFILSDGISTIPSILFIILYRELGFTHVHSLIISVLLAFMATISAYFFMLIRKYWSLTTKAMIMICLGLYMLLTLYVSVSPLVTDKVGLRSSIEGWVCTAYLGMIISTFYSSMRVMLSELCPEGDENEWFSLYLLADKGSSWLGPLVTGAIYTATHEYRRAFWFPMGLIVLGGAILLTVDVDEGKNQAHQFAKEKRERKEQRIGPYAQKI